MKSRIATLQAPAAALLVPLLLAGCALFAPRYDPALDQSVTGAYQSVARFAANGELGTYEDKSSFAATAPQYADAEAALAVAKLRAATLPVQGKPATHARELLVKLIQGCSDQVASYAQQHKQFGIQPASGATQPMMVACDQAAKAASALKPGN